jgi:indolepyruvate ferredoxin oxidoreductase, beta subunit
MKGVTSLVFAGVGGQGLILATRVTALAAHLAGRRTVSSEVHGMAQRGGAVLTTVRFGERVWAPAVPRGEADVVIGLERLEGLRALPLLRPGGTLLLNDRRLMPAVEALKRAPYPSDAGSRAASSGVELLEVEGQAIAERLGNHKLSSAAVLGALSTLLDLPLEAWVAAVAEVVPPRTLPLNRAAFDQGRVAVGDPVPAASG